jgi:hypothetical protein
VTVRFSPTAGALVLVAVCAALLVLFGVSARGCGPPEPTYTEGAADRDRVRADVAQARSDSLAGVAEAHEARADSLAALYQRTLGREAEAVRLREAAQADQALARAELDRALARGEPPDVVAGLCASALSACETTAAHLDSESEIARERANVAATRAETLALALRVERSARESAQEAARWQTLAAEEERAGRVHAERLAARSRGLRPSVGPVAVVVPGGVAGGVLFGAETARLSARAGPVYGRGGYGAAFAVSYTFGR